MPAVVAAAAAMNLSVLRSAEGYTSSMHMSEQFIEADKPQQQN